MRIKIQISTKIEWFIASGASYLSKMFTRIWRQVIELLISPISHDGKNSLKKCTDPDTHANDL